MEGRSLPLTAAKRAGRGFKITINEAQNRATQALTVIEAEVRAFGRYRHGPVSCPNAQLCDDSR